MAYKEGVNSDFFRPFTFTPRNAGCSVNGLWLSKSFPLTNPCIQLCRDANKRPSMDFHHSSPETDPLASGSWQVMGLPPDNGRQVTANGMHQR